MEDFSKKTYNLFGMKGNAKNYDLDQYVLRKNIGLGDNYKEIVDQEGNELSGKS